MNKSPIGAGQLRASRDQLVNGLLVAAELIRSSQLGPGMGRLSRRREAFSSEPGNQQAQSTVRRRRAGRSGVKAVDRQGYSCPDEQVPDVWLEFEKYVFQLCPSLSVGHGLAIQEHFRVIVAIESRNRSRDLTFFASSEFEAAPEPDDLGVVQAVHVRSTSTVPKVPTDLPARVLKSG